MGYVSLSKKDLLKIVYQLEKSIETFNLVIDILEPAMISEDFELFEYGMQKVADSISTVKQYLA